MSKVTQQLSFRVGASCLPAQGSFSPYTSPGSQLGWEGPGKSPQPQTDPPPYGPPGYVNISFLPCQNIFSSLLTMQKWSSKHIKSTQGEKGPSRGSPAGRAQGPNLVPPARPRGRGHPASSPCPAPPIASTPTPRDTSTEPPLPPAIIWGVSARPGAAASSLHLYILYYYVAELLFLPMEVGNTVRTRAGRTPCSSPNHPLSPGFWAWDPHSHRSMWSSHLPKCGPCSQCGSPSGPRGLPLGGPQPES